MERHEVELTQGETGWLLQNELASLEHAFASGDALGVPAHSLVGTEIDFTIDVNNTPEQQAALEATRTIIGTELSLLVPKSEEQARRKADWLRQIPELTSQELVVYNIHRRLSVPTLDSPTPELYLQADDSPETTLEFVFGNGLYQTGYYDNPGLFEMRTQAAKPTIAMERMQRVLTVADEVANSFGARFSYRSDQTNFSVWAPTSEGLRPLHSLHSPEGQEVARRATAGILHALRDGVAALHPPPIFRLPHNEEVQIRAKPERGGTLRVVPDRFEQRRAVELGNHVLGALILMSGFVHGTTEPELDTDFVRKESQNLLMAGQDYDKVRDLHLLRGLQGSELVDGRFVFDGMRELAWDQTERMLTSIMGVEHVYMRAQGAEIIQALLGCISIDQDDRLVVDEQAFEKIVTSAKGHQILLEGSPNETMSERLLRLKISRAVAITGSVDYTWPSGVSLHKDLEGFVQAPSLRSISQSSLEAVRRIRGAAFTHEEAVAEYYYEKTGRVSISVEEKLAGLGETLTRFPAANHGKTIQLIRAKAQRDVAALAERMAAHQAQPKDDFMRASTTTYQDWQEQQKEALALLQALIDLI